MLVTLGVDHTEPSYIFGVSAPLQAHKNLPPDVVKLTYCQRLLLSPVTVVIEDAPDDDAPKLAFADWLEERGQEVEAQGLRHAAFMLSVATYEDGMTEREYMDKIMKDAK